MPKYLNRPEQLRLELRWDYLKGLVATSESFDLYEVATRSLFGKALIGPPGNDVNSDIDGRFQYQSNAVHNYFNV